MRDKRTKTPGDSVARVIAALEDGIPLASEPFVSLAAGLGMTEDQLLGRVKALVASGVIRRIGAVIDRRALGYATTLAAGRAARSKEAAAIRLINSYEEVTHHYRRGGSDLDLWFTLSAPRRARIKEILGDIESSRLFDRIVEFPATRRFKADARFSKMAGGARDE